MNKPLSSGHYPAYDYQPRYSADSGAYDECFDVLLQTAKANMLAASALKSYPFFLCEHCLDMARALVALAALGKGGRLVID